MTKLEHRKRTLEEQLADAPAPAPRLHPGLADVYRRKVGDLHEALAEPDERDEALGYLRGLVERIDMTPVDGGFEIELIDKTGNTAALSLGGDKKGKAVLDERTACSVKVVRGQTTDQKKPSDPVTSRDFRYLAVIVRYRE